MISAVSMARGSTLVMTTDASASSPIRINRSRNCSACERPLSDNPTQPLNPPIFESTAHRASPCRMMTSLVKLSRQMLDEPFQLLEVAALEGAVAVDGVLGHDRVTGVPIRLRLGVEPEEVARLLAHLLQHPGLGRVVVVAGVAQQNHARLGADLATPPFPERLEGVAVVGVAVDPDDIGLGVDAVHRLGDVLDAFEELRHLVD